jgi:hypothetical protein
MTHFKMSGDDVTERKIFISFFLLFASHIDTIGVM